MYFRRIKITEDPLPVLILHDNAVYKEEWETKSCLWNLLAMEFYIDHVLSNFSLIHNSYESHVVWIKNNKEV